MHRTGRLAVDKGVANRFIKHAIAQIKFDRPPGQDEGISSQQDVRVPVKVTEKMIARAQYEKELKELGSEEEDDLEVIDDAESQSSSSNSPPSDKGKGKASAEDLITDVAQTVAGQKRRRPAVDPFAGTHLSPHLMPLSLFFPKGYGDTPSPGPKGSNKLAKPSPDSTEASRSSTPQPLSDAAKAAKKASKKAKRKAKQQKASSTS